MSKGVSKDYKFKKSVLTDFDTSNSRKLIINSSTEMEITGDILVLVDLERKISYLSCFYSFELLDTSIFD